MDPAQKLCANQQRVPSSIKKRILSPDSRNIAQVPNDVPKMGRKSTKPVTLGMAAAATITKKPVITHRLRVRIEIYVLRVPSHAVVAPDNNPNSKK